jgi:hypothetical protein
MNVALVFLVAILQRTTNQRLEQVKFDQRRREQAAIVANLLAKWMVADSAKRDEVEEMNRLNWEAVIWLPEDLSRLLQLRLLNAKDAPSTKQLILDARGIVWGAPCTMQAGEIIHFNVTKAAQAEPGKPA